ncbi:MAG: hypothetical protein HUJ80_04400 [Firmicutes bacterium]|nr:hypothetical protein [Bacillota bacterium]
MKFTTRLTALLLAMLLVLSGCGNKNETPEPSPAPVPETPVQPADPSPAAQPAVPAVETFSFADGSIDDLADLSRFLQGTWTYEPGFETDQPFGVSQIVFIDADKSFEIRFADESRWKGMSLKGTYSFDSFTDSKAPLDQLLCLRANDSFDGMGKEILYGDYMIGAVAMQDGCYALSLVQANNGEGLFDSLFYDFYPILHKEDAEAACDAPRVEESFLGYLWAGKENLNGEFLISDMASETEIAPSSVYTIADGWDAVYMPDNFDTCNVWPVYATTDPRGELILVEFFRTDMENTAVFGSASPVSDIRGYIPVVRDYSVSDEKTTIYAYTVLPWFLGSGEVCRILNESIEAIDTTYNDGIEGRLAEELEFFKSYNYDELSYGPISVTSVYMDPYEPLSICMNWEWNMGGVGNGGYYTLTIDPYTGFNILLEDFLDMSREDLDKKLVDLLYEEYGMDFSNTIGIVMDYKWYMNPSSIFVVFDSYEIDQGPSPLEICLPR